VLNVVNVTGHVEPADRVALGFAIAEFLDVLYVTHRGSGPRTNRRERAHQGTGSARRELRRGKGVEGYKRI
jgi:hypothetical protein